MYTDPRGFYDKASWFPSCGQKQLYIRVPTNSWNLPIGGAPGSGNLWMYLIFNDGCDNLYVMDVREVW
jgi:hypothetical protein